MQTLPYVFNNPKPTITFEVQTQCYKWALRLAKCAGDFTEGPIAIAFLHFAQISTHACTLKITSHASWSVMAQFMKDATSARAKSHDVI